MANLFDFAEINVGCTLPHGSPGSVVVTLECYYWSWVDLLELVLEFESQHRDSIVYVC